ncbi:MAG: hypothetical protein LKF61_04110 [Eggerthellaceae bacterium]|jgi:hypothetical protein|nr:hypothetical protein [Eggerthellaceae bacterium]MCH4221293.1 hypothetical protein [Eggerthellaceae bacterium]
MNNFANILLKRFGTNEPILVEDMCALFSDVSRQTIYRWLNASLENGTLAKYGRGIYFIPCKTRFGRSRLFPEQVVQRKWIENNGDIVGYVSGPTLVNSVGITEQVSATLEVTTNRETTRVRSVPTFGGWKSIRLRRPRTTVTKQNVQALRFLDVATEEPVNDLNAHALDALRRLAQKAGRRQIYDCAAYYPAKTAKKLIDCEYCNVLA